MSEKQGPGEGVPLGRKRDRASPRKRPVAIKRDATGTPLDSHHHLPAEACVLAPPPQA